jgi:hypothetical protein
MQLLHVRLRQSSNKRRRRCLLRTLQAWRRHTVSVQHTAHAALTLFSDERKRTATMALCAWTACRQQCDHAAALHSQAQQHWARQLRRQALHHWRFAAAVSQQWRGLVAGAKLHRQRRLRCNALACWRRQAAQRRLLRHGWQLAAETCRRALLKRQFSVWQTAWLAQQQQRKQLLGAFQHQATHALKSRVLQAWQRALSDSISWRQVQQYHAIKLMWRALYAWTALHQQTRLRNQLACTSRLRCDLICRRRKVCIMINLCT